MWLIIKTFAQVNQVIDEAEDLLAVESGLSLGQLPNENKVGPYEIPIEQAPPGFPGERLTSSDFQEQQGQKIHMDLGNPNGKYSFRYVKSIKLFALEKKFEVEKLDSYLSDDGTSRNEEGSTDPVEGNRQSGGWEYVGPDGKTYSISFVADQNGFRPVGEHLVRFFCLTFY